MKVYLVNLVNSEGYCDGTEADIKYGVDKEDVLIRAYDRYVDDYTDAKENGYLDCPEDEMLSFEEFCGELTNGNRFTYIQMYDSHKQYEYHELEV